MSLQDFLRRQPVSFQTLLHRPSSSSSRFAESLHVPGRRVAKGVVVRVGEGYGLAVLPASSRIDWERLSEVFPGQVVALASEDEVERLFPDCERGAVPPFGRLYGLPTIVEASLAESDPEIVCVGNQRHEALRLRYHDFEALVGPVRARFAVAIGDRSNQRPVRNGRSD